MLAASSRLAEALKLIWIRTALILAAASLVGLIAGWAAGPAWGLAVPFTVVVLVLLRHLANLHALVVWLRDPQYATVPDGSGVWENVFTALYRLQRSTTQRHHRLTGQLARFRSAAQAMPDGVVVLDAEDRISWCNGTAEHYFGLEARKDAGQSLLNLVRTPAFVDYVRGGDFREPLLLRLARAEELVLSIRFVPYGQDEKLLLARDVTQAEKLDTMRRDFVANVSHEMKTPLTVVSGFLETIVDGTVDVREPRGRQVLDLMRTQTDRMLHLIDDLLTLSSLETTAMPADEAPIDVVALLQSLHEDAVALSAGRHTVALDIESPAVLYGSEKELRSAFANLVSNAVRYTPKGGAITLAWSERDGEGVFSVEDSGIGIEAKHIPRITERFYRVDTSRSRDTGGTGLGLAIVKHVLTRHQATLEVRSEVGEGSRFSAVFPARRVRLLPAPRALAETA